MGKNTEKHTDPRRALLDRDTLFSPLSSAERDALAPKLVRRPFAAGEAMVRQGEAGDSLFLIVEGHLSAMFAPPGRAEREAGKLAPGDCFGEMSLMTGAPRSATVVARTAGVAYELAKADITPVLASRPIIILDLGNLMARRQSVLDAIAAEHPDIDRSDAKNLGATICKWISAGFRLAPNPAADPAA
jgi:CRP-like cAMP-binding protein